MAATATSGATTSATNKAVKSHRARERVATGLASDIKSEARG